MTTLITCMQILQKATEARTAHAVQSANKPESTN